MKRVELTVGCDVPGCVEARAALVVDRTERAALHHLVAMFTGEGWHVGRRRQWCPGHRRRADRSGRRSGEAR